MLYSIASTDRSRWRRLIVAAVAALLVLAALTTYSVLAHHQRDAARPAFDSAGSTTRPSDVDKPSAARAPAPLAVTADPETFARRVAEALFGWDTKALTTPSDLTERLVTVADPTGESSAGLVADIASYLPTSDAWAELRQYQTRQWIETTSAEVPSLWPTAVQQAGPDGLLPGTTAFTIRGVRHRFGVWEGESVSSAHDVAFTVFIVCAPSYPECHLLRVSMLDNPLD